MIEGIKFQKLDKKNLKSPIICLCSFILLSKLLEEAYEKAMLFLDTVLFLFFEKF
jgi:hypothetical protein